ncbi:helix-turn-helix transcriptional regulator [Paeniglutamicibacter antarcticus]|uniref:Helix-turn-helix transcriptional regulator n=1 Tax=Arthrobacter terrae TaxID=2935737 RepID=A0A931CUV0_9MICC|nr:helix-turn-helix transcriptional regulator [Arthrobacter terrae]MBG0741799.1 helix-turn-helix transcriptional regulator [Arthrobacter terrae]
MSLAEAFSSEIRAELGRQKMTGLTLAGKVGMSQNYIAKRLRDELPFTLTDIAIICDSLGKPFSEISQRVTASLKS